MKIDLRTTCPFCHKKASKVVNIRYRCCLKGHENIYWNVDSKKWGIGIGKIEFAIIGHLSIISERVIENAQD